MAEEVLALCLYWHGNGVSLMNVVLCSMVLGQCVAKNRKHALKASPSASKSDPWGIYNLLDQVSAYVGKTLCDNPCLQAKIKES